MYRPHNILCTTFLKSDGTIANEAGIPNFATDEQWLLAAYGNMCEERAFSIKGVNMNRVGKIGTFASSEGEEATNFGMSCALLPVDTLFPTYRAIGTLVQRGMTYLDLLAYWGGSEIGNTRSTEEKLRGEKFEQDFPPCVPIASHIPHAVGKAYANKILKKPGAVLAIIGDGGSSKGIFYESMNMAGVWKVPIVFVIVNNRWAISVPSHQQTVCRTFAQKGIAAGLDCLQVDGNDVIAVRHEMEQALMRARHTNRPTLIESLTYRVADHTTADDASRYRSDEELVKARQYCPIKRLGLYLMSSFGIEEDMLRQIKKEAEQKILAVAKQLDSIIPESPEVIFDHIYKKPPPALKEQRAEMLSLHSKEKLS